MNRKLLYWFGASLLFMGCLFAQVDPGTANLKHSWTFDDGTAIDVVGGANGNLMGAAVIEDGALITANKGDYLEMPADVIALNTYLEFTVEVWFQSIAGANTSYHMFFYFGGSKNAMGYNGFFLTPVRGDNKSRAAISCWTDTPYQGETGADGPEYDDGELHHMVATLNNSEINLYLDGVLATPPAGGKQSPQALATNNSIDGLDPSFCYLSKSGYDGDATWLGMFHECNIYDRVLNADEVLFLYQHDPTTAVKANVSPKGFALHQNYPNPFNPNTTVSFTLEKKSKVTIGVYDLLGHRVAELLDDTRDAGEFNVTFDGSKLSSGMYLCKMQIDGKQTLTQKMMLLK